LRFQIEVASDQATEALRAVTAAVNEAGVKMRGSFSAIGPAVRSAGTEIGGLTESIKKFVSEERSQARTAGFFVREIAEIVPVSGEAKGALTQLGGALLGGGIVGIGLAAAVGAVRLLTAAWREEAEAAKKAAEGNARAIDALQGRLESVRRARMSPAEVDKESLDVVRMQMEGNNALIAGLEKRNALIRDQIKYLEYTPRELGENEQRIRQAKEQNYQLERRAEILAETVRLEVQNADAAEAARRAAQGQADVEIRQTKAKVGDVAPWRRVDMSTEVVGRDDQLKLGKQLDFATERQELYNEQVEASIALAQEWGDAIGSALGDLATRQITIGEAMAQVAKTVLQSIIKSAIAQITANAAVTGTEAAKSQAGIPVVGPALAVAAMSAMSALVMAQLSNVPSAAGGWWDTGNYTGLAMVHPRELIADEPLANAIRSGGSRGWTVNIVGPMDGRSVERVFASNQGPIAKIRRRWDRRGRA
jgi:hypothetical protein